MLQLYGRCARPQLAKRIFLAALMLLAAGAASGAPLHRYLVEVGESLDLLAVKACFDGKVPNSALVAETSGARTFLEEVRLSGRLLQPQGGELIALDGAADNACVDYRVKLRPATSATQTGGPETRRIGRDLLAIGGRLVVAPAGARGRHRRGIVVRSSGRRCRIGAMGTRGAPKRPNRLSGSVRRLTTGRPLLPLDDFPKERLLCRARCCVWRSSGA